MTVTESAPGARPGGDPTAPRRPLQRAVEGRRHRAAQRQRDVEAGGRRAQRPRADRADLLARGLRVDPAAGPLGPVPLVGALHPAQARHRRRPHGPARRHRALRRVLHAARPPRRWGDLARPAAHPRRDQPGVRPRHGRHQRPAEHPVPLDPRRGRARDLAPPRGGRPADDGGVRRHPTRHPRQPARRRGARTRSSTRRRSSTRSSTATSATPSSPTCPASSSPPSPGTRASTSCTRSTTSPSSGSCTPSSAPATTCGSAGASRRRRVSPSGSGSSCAPRRPPRSGTASSGSSATTATAGCATRRA